MPLLFFFLFISTSYSKEASCPQGIEGVKQLYRMQWGDSDEDLLIDEGKSKDTELLKAINLKACSLRNCPISIFAKGKESCLTEALVETGRIVFTSKEDWTALTLLTDNLPVDDVKLIKRAFTFNHAKLKYEGP